MTMWMMHKATDQMEDHPNPTKYVKLSSIIHLSSIYLGSPLSTHSFGWRGTDIHRGQIAALSELSKTMTNVTFYYPSL